MQRCRGNCVVTLLCTKSKETGLCVECRNNKLRWNINVSDIIRSGRVAYTIGNTKSYDRGLIEYPEYNKLGRTEDYEGGWIWKTPGEARDFIENTELPFDASVYELELPTSWNVDVSEGVSEDGVHRLINDADIVRKIAWRFTFPEPIPWLY